MKKTSYFAFLFALILGTISFLSEAITGNYNFLVLIGMITIGTVLVMINEGILWDIK